MITVLYFFGMFGEMIRSWNFLIKLDKFSGIIPTPELFRAFWWKKEHHYFSPPAVTNRGVLVVWLDWKMALPIQVACLRGHFQNYPPGNDHISPQIHGILKMICLFSPGGICVNSLEGSTSPWRPFHPPVRYHDAAVSSRTDPSPRWASIAFGTSTATNKFRGDAVQEATWDAQKKHVHPSNPINLYLFYEHNLLHRQIYVYIYNDHDQSKSA